jgi:very-short-patch-repair endonuclease
MNAESPIEVKLINAIHGCLLHPSQIQITPQKTVETPSGTYRVDIALEHHGERVAVECDGARWHSTDSQKLRDASRDLALMHAGWWVVRFTGSEIHNETGVCAIVSLLALNRLTFERTREHLTPMKPRAAATP